MLVALLGLALAAVALFLIFGLPVLSLLRLNRVVADIDRLRARVDELSRTVDVLKRSTAPAAPATSAPVATAAVISGQDVEVGREPEAVFPAVPADEDRPASGISLERPWEAVPSALAPEDTSPPSSPPLSTGADGPAAAAPGAAGFTPPPAASSQPAPPRIPVPSTQTLEARIGSRWLLYIGIGALVLGVAYFVKYAFDNEWLGPRTRVVFGIAIGAGLVSWGHRLARGLAPLFGQTLAGGGLAILYVSIYAAHQVYGLIGTSAAFVAHLTVTLTAAALATRLESQPLALAAAIGGFMTPFLVATSRDAQVSLFLYDALLVVGCLALARRFRWATLALVSYLLTLATVAAWMAIYWSPSRWRSSELLLTLLCALFLIAIRTTWRMGTPAGNAAALLIASAPALYHVASYSILLPHPVWMLVYFIAATTAGLAAASHWRSPWLRLLILIAVGLPFFGWIARYPGVRWLMPGMVAALAMFGLHLMVSLRDASATPRAPEIFAFHANGLWVYAALAMMLDRHQLASLGTVAAVLAGAYLVIFVALRARAPETALHALALAFVLAAIGIFAEWSGPWIAVGWVAEGAALALIGLRMGRGWLRVVGALLLVLGLLKLSGVLTDPASADWWPVFNPRAAATLFCVAVLYALAAAHTRAGGSSTDDTRAEIATLIIAANVLTLGLLTAEINLLFGIREWTAVPGGAGPVGLEDLARQVTLSTVWALYAVALVAIGIWRRYAPIRYLAIAVFAVTAAKVFFVDLDRLDRIYRVLSVVGLGVLLLAASYLYQRFNERMNTSNDAPDPR